MIVRNPQSHLKVEESPGQNGKDGEGHFFINRRQFLKLGAGIVILFPWGDTEAQQGRPQLPTDYNAFLHIGEDGRVTCFTGKVELGQGINTSLAQMLAEELDVPLQSVKMVMGDGEDRLLVLRHLFCRAQGRRANL